METREHDVPEKEGIYKRGLIVGDIQDQMIEGKTFRASPSNPHKDIYPMLFEVTIETGTRFTAVLSAIRVVKDSICAISSSNLSIFEQPERMNVFTDFNLYISLGRLLRFVQSFKFINKILQRSPMDLCIANKLGQSLRMSCSILGSLEKSGVSVKYLE